MTIKAVPDPQAALVTALINIVGKVVDLIPQLILQKDGIILATLQELQDALDSNSAKTDAAVAAISAEVAQLQAAIDALSTNQPPTQAQIDQLNASSDKLAAATATLESDDAPAPTE